LILSAVLLASALVLVIWLSAGIAGLIYAIVCALVVTPGLPIGFALFGRRHAAGWISGALFGYGLAQLAIWAVIVAGWAHAAVFTLLWGVLAGVAWRAAGRSRREPYVALPAWTAKHSRALLLTLLLVPVLMGPPYARLGARDESGNRYYRAYFTADFLWHASLAHELGKFSLPPTNPYMAPRTMNYYWTYFLLPATFAELAPGSAGDVQRALKVNAILTATAMLAALFLVVSTAAERPGAAALAVVLAVVAASYEGTYTLVDYLQHGIPLDRLRDTNIDAITAWRWNGLRIDNVPRSMWYTPQHTMSVALGLVAIFCAIAAGARAHVRAILGAGLALGLSATINPFLGGAFSIIYGLVIVADALRARAGIAAVVRHLVAAIPVMLAVAWGAVGRVAEGAGSALTFGLAGYARNRPLQTLLFGLGPVLLPALGGLWPTQPRSWRPVAAGAAGIAVGLALLYFVRLSDASWVGFRAGQILLVSIPILLARVLDVLRPAARGTLTVAILAFGLPTTIVDSYNAQDIGNRRQGPGFHWTIHTTPAQQEAFAWLRQHTPEDTIVQMDAFARGREHWTLIPSFAGRRMAAGLPISLLPQPQYRERSALVRQMYATGDAREAWSIARRFDIDYVYLDAVERRTYPQGIGKFDDGRFFERVFAREDVAVYRVK
jgi:hypothetical protein